MLLVFRVRCGTVNSNQAKEYGCVMQFPLIHFNVLVVPRATHTVTCTQRFGKLRE